MRYAHYTPGMPPDLNPAATAERELAAAVAAGFVVIVTRPEGAAVRFADRASHPRVPVPGRAALDDSYQLARAAQAEQAATSIQLRIDQDGNPVALTVGLDGSPRDVFEVAISGPVDVQAWAERRLGVRDWQWVDDTMQIGRATL